MRFIEMCEAFDCGFFPEWLNEAIIGYTEICGENKLVYDYEAMIDILVNNEGYTEEAAELYIDCYNFTGSEPVICKRGNTNEKEA